MAEHAAPTSVTIAATEEESFLQKFVKRYWLVFAGLAVAIAIGIVWTQSQREAKQAELNGSWDGLASEIGFGDAPDPNGGFAQGAFTLPEAATLAALAADLGDGPAAPWAKALEVGTRLRGGDTSGALAAAGELEANWSGHPLATLAMPFDEDDPKPLAEHLRARIQEVENWEASHPGLFGNPPLPDGSPSVTIQTSKGAIRVGLYAEQAPQHVENFLTRAESGGYDQTKFHSVRPGRSLHAGDPNSVEGPPETWGQGDGGTTLAREANDLHNFQYVLGMETAIGSSDSSDARFYITLSDQFYLDAQRTAFGVVLEGQDVLEAIVSERLEGARPETPVVIESTAVSR